MAYQNVGTPRFYVSILQWLKSLGSAQPGGVYGFDLSEPPLNLLDIYPSSIITLSPNEDTTGDSDYDANTTTRRWTVTNLNGVIVATNGYDAPQTWPLKSSGIPLLTVPFVRLRNFPEGEKCKSIRSFRTFLIGLNWERTNEEPRLVKWSTEASYGSPPVTWLESDATLDAGEYELADTPGNIIDGLPLGDSFLIYKDDSIYIMNYVGTPYIFSF